jgi:cyclomaltodextrinase
MYQDNIFGTQIDEVERVAYQRSASVGVRHRYQLDPVDPRPGLPIAVTLSTGGPLPYAAARCWWWAELADGQVEHGTFDLEPGLVTWEPLAWGYARSWHGQLPARPSGTLLRYKLAARITGSGDWAYADGDALDEASATEFVIWLTSDAAPAWAREAVVYHIFIDRFNPGTGRVWHHPARLDGFYGGTLRGVIEKLDYIQELGFTAIWLSPVFASPSHHGYDATDLYTVEPRLGSNADLLELFALAHARGMRVILDFVANHWSALHPTFVAARTDEASEFHDWYTWESWPDTYKCYFGVRELPELNLNYPPTRTHILDAAAHWLRAGADGLRLDYAYGPSHAFWADFLRTCRAARPDCWLFGEIIHQPDFLRTYAGRMDGVLDFPLTHALRETFARATWDLARLEAFLASHEAYFPPHFIRPLFLDNHDMNRFLFMTGENRAMVRLAALILFTLPGPPIVYYGTEVGVGQERPIHGENSFGVFEEARQPMKWGAYQDGELHEFFRHLVALRRAHPALLDGARRVLYLDVAAATYAYVREGTTPVIVVVHMGNSPTELRLPRAGLPASATDKLGGHPVWVTGEDLTVKLPAQSGAWIA